MTIFTDAPDTVQPSEGLALIYGSTDARWAELQRWLETAENDRGIAIEDLGPFERAVWHSVHVLGVEKGRMMAVYPAFPESVGPEWASAFEDAGVSVEDGTLDFPARNWVREIALPAGCRGELTQMQLFDPESGDVITRPVEAVVYLPGGEGPIRIRSDVEALNFSAALLNAGRALEKIARGGALD